jgi:hypothetical protein
MAKLLFVMTGTTYWTLKDGQVCDRLLATHSRLPDDGTSYALPHPVCK